MSQPVALIAGAASGIGEAVAIAYAKKGVRVVGGYLPSAPHDPLHTQRLVEEAGSECLMIPKDVTDSASLDAIAAAVERFGRLDYAVANAGLLRKASLLERRMSNGMRCSMSTSRELCVPSVARAAISVRAVNWSLSRQLLVVFMGGKTTHITRQLRRVYLGFVARWR